MIFESVNFNDEEVRKMSAVEFEARHVNLLWKDRDPAIRKKMLSQAYGIITGTPERRKKKSSK